VKVSQKSPHRPLGNLSSSSKHNHNSTVRWQIVLKRTAVVLLLLAIPILSTLAKQSWYLPQADTAHYLNGAIKMKVSHAPLLVRWEPTVPVVKFVPPPSPFEKTKNEEPNPPAPDTGLAISLQRRPPPSAIS
jgi:hypothetical protein